MLRRLIARVDGYLLPTAGPAQSWVGRHYLEVLVAFLSVCLIVVGLAFGLAALTVFVAAVSAILTGGLLRPHAYLPKYDTQTKLFTVLVLVSTLLALSMAGAVRLAQGALRSDEPLLLVLALLLGVPLPLALHVYAGIESSLRKLYRDTADTTRRFQDLIAEIEAQSEKRGIAAPEVTVVRQPFLSPQVAGSFTKVFLIMPVNYFDVLDALRTKLTDSTVSKLHRFILAHELSHVEYRDYLGFTWLCLFVRKLVLAWLPLYVLSIVVTAMSGALGSNVLGKTLYLAALPLLYLLALYALTRAIMRDREFLADQRALAATSREGAGEPAILRKPAAPSGGMMPLELALGLFRGGPAAHFGVSLSSSNPTSRFGGDTIGAAVAWLLAGHPGSDARVEALTSTRDPLLTRRGDIENGVFAGVALGLLLLNWVVSLVAWPSVSGLMLTGGGFGGAALLALMLFLPVKHARSLSVSFGAYERASFRKLALAWTTASAMIGAMIGPLHDARFLTKMLLGTGLVIAIAYCMSILMIFGIHGRPNDPFPELRPMEIHARVAASLLTSGAFAWAVTLVS